MMYSKESLKKAVVNLKDMTDEFLMKPYKELQLHISKGNRKIGLVHNFSMAPVITCPNCSKCKHYCYDIKAVLQYPNVLKARAENTAMMMQDRFLTFCLIEHYIENQKAHKVFRWHVSGDIIDVDYFDRMVQIARNHTDWIFWTYTKNYRAVNEWIRSNGGRESVPSNLSVMYSVWNGMPCPNPFQMPTFVCVQEGMQEPDAWKCPGNCDICLRSGHGCPFRESSYVHEH